MVIRGAKDNSKRSWDKLLSENEKPDFAQWSQQWINLAKYPGSDFQGCGDRIPKVLNHWQHSIPGIWKRGKDPQLLGPRYRRGNKHNPGTSEHRIEHDILCEFFSQVSILDSDLIDGVNSVPLVQDKQGVHADMCLLTRKQGQYRIVLAEVKSTSNHAWYATVENLRQLRLLLESEEALRLFHHRNPELELPAYLPVTGVVLAPMQYYSQRGQKRNSTEYASKLISALRMANLCDIRLTVWKPDQMQVVEI